MKKITVLYLCFFVMVLIVTAARSDVTDTSPEWRRLGVSGTYYTSITYTDDGTGFSNALTLPSGVYGKNIYKIVHIPGIPAITNNVVDIAVLWRGQDIFNGLLSNISNSVNKSLDFETYGPLDSEGITITLSDNLVNGATGTIVLYAE